MGDSHFIRGGDYAPPRAWVERLAAVGFEVELPDDLRPVTGGTFGIRFKPPEVTGGEDALVRVGVLHHLLAAGPPTEVVELFERRFQELVDERWPGSVLLNRALSLGWAKDGRAGAPWRPKRTPRKHSRRKKGPRTDRALESWRSLSDSLHCPGIPNQSRPKAALG